jgi:hypothetical protein
MNCEKCKIEIEERDLRRERLSDAATAHVASCASCRVFGEERLALRRLIGGLEKVSAPADFDFRMRARIAAEPSTDAARAGWFNFLPAAAFSWPLAACFALAISAALYFQQQRQFQQQPGANAMTHEQASNAVVSQTPTPQSPMAEATPQSAPAKIIETGRGVGAPAVSKNALVAQRRALPMRVAGSTRIDAPRIRAGVEESSSAGLYGSSVRYVANGTPAGERSLIPVQVSAQERPLKVLLRDTGGGARTISVESVSFGSRDVMGRPATISKASLSTNQGVW